MSNDLKHDNPDVAKTEEAPVPAILERVGMSRIATQIRLEGKKLSSLTDTYVNLVEPLTKGIHMSRIYNLVQEEFSEKDLTPETLGTILDKMIASQNCLSDSASLALDFQLPLQRKALLTEKSGLRFYPTRILYTKEKGQPTLEVQLTITYSSTCPCSAALSRKLNHDRFQEKFSQNENISMEEALQFIGDSDNSLATPHSQRSDMELRLQLDPTASTFNLVHFIDLIENTLKTPVQTSVKRTDEQEFARLNGENLMFCEDAARKVKHALNEDSAVLDFYIKAIHRESLHAHDAVSQTVKGIEGGYTVNRFQ